jgi:hypothetical protein
METGGALWFENLCMSDPFYLLPLLTSTTLYLQVFIETGTISTLENFFFSICILKGLLRTLLVNPWLIMIKRFKYQGNM